jgi:mono/diheme cytochrome c family protein
VNRRKTFATLTGAALSVSAFVAIGCTSHHERTTTISTADLRVDPRLAEGQRVFMAQCNQCHVGGAGGLGPSLNDNRIPSFLIKFQVRHAPGTMPKFSKNVISDAQLDDVIKYMRFLRNHPDSSL